METNLPNPIGLNEEDLNECKRITGWMSTHVVCKSFAKGLTATIWTMIMLYDIALESGVAKSNADVLMMNKKLFDAVASRYKNRETNPTPNSDTVSDHQPNTVSDHQPDSVSASRPNSDIR